MWFLAPVTFPPSGVPVDQLRARSRVARLLCAVDAEVWDESLSYPQFLDVHFSVTRLIFVASPLRKCEGWRLRIAG